MSEYLAPDLILQIFSRLPAKSIARFRCVSKLWASLLICPYFTELFSTQSKTRPPRLLFAVRQNEDEWRLYSFPQPQISYKNTESSLSVTAEYHMRLTKARFLHISPSVSGFIYFSNRPKSNTPILCNPSTGHLFLVPHTTKSVHSFFGYDPIDKQFSVLAICRPVPSRYQILKLGSETLSWRNIECPLHHYALQTNICINGILYYIASFGIEYHHKIACFHLNSEEFNFVDVPFMHQPHLHESHLHEPDQMLNFKGKLGVINMKQVPFSEKKYNLELILWVLEDIKKQEWSKHEYVLLSRSWSRNFFPDFSIVGVTTSSEVVLCYTTSPLQVYFFNLEKNILRKVEIKGFEFFNHHNFCGCVDYVEELRNLKWS